jgi:hypothetical protein
MCFCRLFLFITELRYCVVDVLLIKDAYRVNKLMHRVFFDHLSREHVYVKVRAALHFGRLIKVITIS